MALKIFFKQRKEEINLELLLEKSLTTDIKLNFFTLK